MNHVRLFRSTVVSPAMVSLAWLTLAGCGDSKTPVKQPDDGGADSGTLEPDGGQSASSNVGSSTSTVTSSVSSVTSSAADAGVSSCAEIASACTGEDDVDGLGNLCLRVADEASASACDAVATECLAYCADQGSSPLDAGDLDSEQCEAMGDTCHDFDTGSGLGHLCHEVGHSGNVTWCAAIYSDCVELCGEPGDSHHDEDAGDAGEHVTLELQFAAKVGAEDFECGRQYEDVGLSQSTVEPVDLRFFVSNVRLLTETGVEVPAVISDVPNYQSAGVALVDFTDGSGKCTGNTATHTSVRVTAPAGDYAGVAFSSSVPVELNHDDPLTASAPLEAGDMAWSWVMGYKFVKLELQTLSAAPLGDAGQTSDAGTVAVTSADAGVGDASADASVADSGGHEPPVGPIFTMLHVGSINCADVATDAGDVFGNIQCQNSNRNDVVLEDFDVTANVVVFDVAQVVAQADLSESLFCHPAGPNCPAIFETLGVDYESGVALPAYPAFRVE